MLNRMAYPRCEHNFDRKGGYRKRFCKRCSLIKVTKIPREYNSPQYFHLPEVIGLKNTSHIHERACADLYVSLHLTCNPPFWDATPAEEYLALGLKPDRSSIVEGRIIFWEVDKGTETHAVIRGKFEKYVELSANHPDRRFYVVFTGSKGRVKEILTEVLPEFRRGNQFLVAEHNSVVERPLEPVLVSPVDPMKWLSIADLELPKV